MKHFTLQNKHMFWWRLRPLWIVIGDLDMFSSHHLHRSVARFRKKFSTLCSLLNSAPLCIFSTLLHKSEENCFTNIPHPLNKFFCKQPCDWLIKQRVRKIQHPLIHSAPYRACWKCFLKKNSPLSRTKGWWSQFRRLQRVLNFFLKRATDFTRLFWQVSNFLSATSSCMFSNWTPDVKITGTLPALKLFNCF